MRTARNPTSSPRSASKSAQTVVAGENVAPKTGNAMPLSAVPLGTNIHNIELIPGNGGKVARAAGQLAVLSNRDGGWALVKMPSGEIRRFNERCFCTIGQVGNRDHMNETSGKAGRTRWQGVRPTVRGMTMNPVDHPNGGGEGKSKSGGGRQHLLSPWGHAKGEKTRNHEEDHQRLHRRVPPQEEVILSSRTSQRTSTHATLPQERPLTSIKSSSPRSTPSPKPDPTASPSRPGAASR